VLYRKREFAIGVHEQGGIARNDLARGLEQHLQQAGRLPQDLLLPLFATGAAPLDSDNRSRRAVLPLLRRMYDEAVPALAMRWNDTASTTPEWLSAVLTFLEQLGEIEPADLAEMVNQRSGSSLSPERLARQLAKYGIQSTRRSGRRVFSVSAAEIAGLRARYRISVAEADSASTEPAALPSGQ
jgi:hypothetical protein